MFKALVNTRPAEELKNESEKQRSLIAEAFRMLNKSMWSDGPMQEDEENLTILSKVVMNIRYVLTLDILWLLLHYTYLRGADQFNPAGLFKIILEGLKGTAMEPLYNAFIGVKKDMDMCLSCGDKVVADGAKGIMILQLPLKKRMEKLEVGISRMFQNDKKTCQKDNCGGKMASVTKVEEFPMYLILDIQAYSKSSLKMKEQRYTFGTQVMVQGNKYHVRAVVNHGGSESLKDGELTII